METINYSDKKTIYHEVAVAVAEEIQQRSMHKSTIILGLPGGRSICPFLSEFITQQIPWKNVHVFLIDERLVPIDHPDSNYNLICSYLTQVFPEMNLHPFYFNKFASDKGVSYYEQEFHKYGGVFDIIVASVGEDGHIASLFPHHPALQEQIDDYVYVSDAPKHPSYRMSISPACLLRSQIGVLFFMGEEKQHAIQQFVDDDITFEACPAKFMLNIPKLLIATDNKDAFE